MNDITQTDVPHPSEFIGEELEARGWTRDILAVRMGGNASINRLALDMYFEVGPTAPDMGLGSDTAVQLGQAFSVSPSYFLNLEIAWRRGHVRH